MAIRKYFPYVVPSDRREVNTKTIFQNANWKLWPGKGRNAGQLPTRSPAILDFNTFQNQKEILYINYGQFEGFGAIWKDNPKGPPQDSNMQSL